MCVSLYEYIYMVIMHLYLIETELLNQCKYMKAFHDNTETAESK